MICLGNFLPNMCGYFSQPQNHMLRFNWSEGNKAKWLSGSDFSGLGSMVEWRQSTPGFVICLSAGSQCSHGHLWLNHTSFLLSFYFANFTVNQIYFHHSESSMEVKQPQNHNILSWPKRKEECPISQLHAAIICEMLGRNFEDFFLWGTSELWKTFNTFYNKIHMKGIFSANGKITPCP